MNEEKTVDDLAEAMKQGNIDAGIGGAPPASQPVPATPEPLTTEEADEPVEEEAADSAEEGVPEGEVSPEGGA